MLSFVLAGRGRKAFAPVSDARARVIIVITADESERDPTLIEDVLLSDRDVMVVKALAISGHDTDIELPDGRLWYKANELRTDEATLKLPSARRLAILEAAASWGCERVVMLDDNIDRLLLAGQAERTYADLVTQVVASAEDQIVSFRRLNPRLRNEQGAIRLPHAEGDATRLRLEPNLGGSKFTYFPLGKIRAALDEADLPLNALFPPTKRWGEDLIASAIGAALGLKKHVVCSESAVLLTTKHAKILPKTPSVNKAKQNTTRQRFTTHCHLRSRPPLP